MASTDGRNAPAGVRPSSRAWQLLRVKLIGSWGPSAQVCSEWAQMSQRNLRWNDAEASWEDHGVDFYAIVSWPWPGERYDPARTIVFQMEPWCGEPWQTRGVKTWGEWAMPNPAPFIEVRSHSTHLNNAFWKLRATDDELRTRPAVETRGLSTRRWRPRASCTATLAAATCRS